MSPEVPKFNNLEKIKDITIPIEEIKTVTAIRNFIGGLSAQEEKDWNGDIRYPEGVNDTIENLSQARNRVDAEYEACKDVIDYKNSQLKKLLEFVESQKIWSAKFSTAINVSYNPSADNPREDFFLNLEKSEEFHKQLSFAGQNLNSIYYLTPSGMVLRIKVSNLHPNGNIRQVLQSFSELFTCLDEVTDDDVRGNQLNGVFKIDANFISFEPKVGYRLEEFYTKDFHNSKDDTFHSKIKVFKEDGKIVIRGHDNVHSGHFISKVEKL